MFTCSLQGLKGTTVRWADNRKPDVTRSATFQAQRPRFIDIQNLPAAGAACLFALR